jgi:hypothetical protein
MYLMTTNSPSVTSAQGAFTALWNIDQTQLMQQIEADLRAAFPNVQFSVSVPDWLTPEDHPKIEIWWCGSPYPYEARAVIAKHEHHGVWLHLNGRVPCERCGEPTLYQRPETVTH